MSWMDTPVIQELGQYLDLAAYRQSLISSNLANIDTPGYRTQDVDFERTMRHAVANAGARLTRPGRSRCRACWSGRTETTSAWTAKACCWRRRNCNSGWGWNSSASSSRN